MRNEGQGNPGTEKNHRQFVRFKFQRFGVRCRQLPRSSFKPLVPDHEPIAIPEDCFHGVATFVDEEEQVAAQKILFRMSTGSVQRNSLVRDGRLNMAAPHSR